MQAVTATPTAAQPPGRSPHTNKVHPGHARRPRRGALIIAKVIGITVAGLVLSVLTFGLGLATAVAELSAHHLPAGTGTLFAGSVIAGTVFGVIGVALGYITRFTIAVVGAVGWVLFAELAIPHTLAPHLAKWLITGAASTLTELGVLASRALSPATAVAVLSAYAVVLLAVASHLALRAMWPDLSSPLSAGPPKGRYR